MTLEEFKNLGLSKGQRVRIVTVGGSVIEANFSRLNSIDRNYPFIFLNDTILAHAYLNEIQSIKKVRNA